MKKILLTIALTIILGFGANAQYLGMSDSFFNDWDQSDRLDIGGFSFVLPASHGFGEDTPSAPLGSGLLILTALGAGYAVARKRKTKFFCAALLSLLFFSCSKKDQPVIHEDTPGVLSGEFSVSASQKVHFSQGNLQYVGTWQFAENQWDCFGSSQYDNHRDLFGWGTGDAPNNVSTDNNDYGTFVDWGTDAWRTLTKDEWVYLFYTRTNAATLFGLGSVNGVNGTILLPDNWTLPAGASFTASTTQGLEDAGGYYSNPNSDNFSHNTYTTAEWAVMEANGAVFLPAAGSRNGTDVDYVGLRGGYRSATSDDTENAYYLSFGSGLLYPQYNYFRYFGFSVRLVR